MKPIPVKDVKPDPDQPRKTFIEDEEASFIESVKLHGILTPIRVRENGKGYVIVAGERRWRAAKAAKLTTIPAVIANAKPEAALVEATVENVVRLDLNPVEEGHAYRRIAESIQAEGDLNSFPKVAELVSRPVERVRDRVALTTLSDVAQEKIAAGTIPLTAARVLVDVADASPPLAAALAFAVGTLYHGSALATEPDACLRALASGVYRECERCNGQGVVKGNGKAYTEADEFDDAGEKPCPKKCEDGRVKLTAEGAPEWFAISAASWGSGFDAQAIIEAVGGSDEPDHGKPLTEALEALERAFEKAGPGYYGKPAFGEDVKDAARSYGCLVEFGDNAYITDPQFAAEWATVAVKAHTEKVAKTKAENRGSGGTQDDPFKVEQTDEQKAEAAKQRAAAAKATDEARKLNDDLYAKLAVECHKVKPTADLVKAVGNLILLNGQGWLGHSGLGLIDPKLHTVEEPKRPGGKAKFKYADRDASEVAAFDLLNKATSTDQAFGALLQIVLAAMYADDHATPMSDYRKEGLPSLVGWGVGVGMNEDKHPRHKRASKAYTDAYGTLAKFAAKIVPAKLKKNARGAFS